MNRHLRLLGTFGGSVATSVLDCFTWEARIERRRLRREDTVVGVLFFACLIPVAWALSAHEGSLPEARRATSSRAQRMLRCSWSGSARISALAHWQP